MRKLLIATLGLALAGCASSRNPVELPAAAATQPSNAAVTAADFEKLWAAADLAARDLLFTPTRQDRRAGLYETEPLLSGQFFEPWRRDAISAADRAQSSLASIRRTLTIKIDKAEDGSFVAKPRVKVERYALAERRVTTSAGYRSVFRDRNTSFGTIETDAGLTLPQSYWYEVGNDPTLEQYVANAIGRRLK
jgi:hypothetical protein